MQLLCRRKNPAAYEVGKVFGPLKGDVVSGCGERSVQLRFDPTLDGRGAANVVHSEDHGVGGGVVAGDQERESLFR